MDRENKKQLPAWLVLTLISLVAALVLAVTYQITNPIIERNAQAALRESYSALLPADDYVGLDIPAEYGSVSSLVRAVAGGETAGYAVKAAKNGYNGPVAVTFGIDKEGKVTGLVVGDGDFAETAGLGARAKEEAFTSQFVGMDVVQGGSFDALSGATITSTAVLNATNEAFAAVDDAMGLQPESDPLVSFGAKGESSAPSADEPAAPAEGDAYTATGKGLTGSFPVEVRIADGKITAVTVGDSDSESDVPFLSIVQGNADFLAQFVGQSGNIAEVDVASGATVSSQGVLAAVNEVLAGLNGGDAPAAPAVKTVEEDDRAALGLADDGTAVVLPAEDYSGELTVQVTVKDGQITGVSFGQEAPEAPASEAKSEAEPAADAGDGVTVEAKGLTGTFPVTVTFDGDAVASVTLGDSSTDMDAPYLGNVKDDPNFLTQFVGKSGSVAESDVDTVSGATTSSKAVINAVNEALKQAPGGDAKTEAEPAADAGDGVTIEAKGLTGTFPVTVTFDGDAIASVTLGDSSTDMDAPYLGSVKDDPNFLKQFVGKTGSVAESDVDTVSGATTSSKAVINAVNEALKRINQ